MFGSKDGAIEEIPAGTTTYDFSCLLPLHIPATVSGKNGSIRYKVETNIDIPWALDLKAKNVFTVIRNDDLNIFPDLKIPVEVEEIKIFCCFCCKSQPLLMRLRIPKGGFVLGEQIPVSIDMINKSTVEIDKTTLKLKRIDRAFSLSKGNKVEEVKKSVSSSTTQGVKAGESVSLQEIIQVPDNISTSNDLYSNIFKISYEISFCAETNGWNLFHTMVIPVTIGTIAIQNELPSTEQLTSSGQSQNQELRK